MKNLFEIKFKIVYGKGAVCDQQCYHCVESILFICSANQCDGFYVMVILAWDGNVDASLGTSHCF